MSESTNNKEIVVDTNALIYSIKHGVNLKYEAGKISESTQITILECVKSELTGLSRRNMYALLALKEIEPLKAVPSEGEGDECVLKYALRKQCPIITNDRGLIAIAKEKNLTVLTISGGRKLRYA
ncbi:MAG: type II toxin-antitoxin system VapC family toxin [Thermoplasmataceae archaeon]